MQAAALKPADFFGNDDILYLSHRGTTTQRLAKPKISVKELLCPCLIVAKIQDP